MDQAAIHLRFWQFSTEGIQDNKSCEKDISWFW
jgi:hypothetical protein